MNGHELFSRLPSLRTSRLELRALSMRDARDVFAYASDHEVAQYTTWDAHPRLEDSRRFLRTVIQMRALGQAVPWGVVDLESGRVIGTAGFVSWRPEQRRAEVGYAIAKSHWNRGLATEAMAEILRFGWHRMDLYRIEARCLVENSSSERVMQKLAMRFEGVLRGQIFIKGQFRDVKMYAVLRTDLGDALAAQ